MLTALSSVKQTSKKFCSKIHNIVGPNKNINFSQIFGTEFFKISSKNFSRSFYYTACYKIT